MGDAARLRQILVNLVSNAVKFTEEGHISIEVGTEFCPNQNKLTLKFNVRDTGIEFRRRNSLCCSNRSPSCIRPLTASMAEPDWDFPSASGWLSLWAERLQWTVWKA